MGLLDVMAKIAEYMPTTEKPKVKVGLYERMFWTLIALVIYIFMSNIPLYGIEFRGPEQFLLVQIVFAAHAGTLMELGIGPIVTAGLIMQILVGAKMIDLDLTDPDDRKKFTSAQKTFAVVLAAIQSSLYSIACRYWTLTGPNPIIHCTAPVINRVLVSIQLFLATYIIILLDEMIQKGWGLGSGISLFILAGVATTIMWNLLSPVEYGGAPVGFIPYALSALREGAGLSSFLIRPGGRDLLGLIITFVVILILVYLDSMNVSIPITSPRFGSIKSRIPLKFLYVSNIPVLFIGILYADILVFASIFRGYLGGYIPKQVVDILAKYDETGHRLVGGIAYYLSPPNGLIATLQEPVHAIIYSLATIGLAVLFGLMWVEVSGLNAESQAEELIKSGMEIPGVRRNPTILSKMLEKYITPLTILSSIIVALIAILADVLSAYGSGIGLLLAVGIVQQYYTILAYERTLEAYPLLRKLIGE
ncbi:MAG: preprotein translocase subunit SecY [Desulfurococcaceae archaeon]